jgi:long-chain acyl-CoA synthetase
MLITDVLTRNASLYGDEVCLVEVNPALGEKREITWREYELMETNPHEHSRREMTWRQFDDAANRFANLLISQGVGKGDKVAILIMNCLEWLPIYFGILKTGAVAVPMNYRYTAEEIEYGLKLSEARAFAFGPEFIGRIESIIDHIPKVDPRFFVGTDCPSFADSYAELAAECSSEAPQVEVSEEDDAALYFSSGTTGFPKAILHDHRSIMSACVTEQEHHGREDALVRQPSGREQGRPVARDEAGVDIEDHLRRESHDRLAPCPLGPRYPRRPRQRGRETR